ncbi:MAG: hypothetical protein H6668_22565 [Ardenticatenaceae bacterium]|nr:hypothetical protein [Ardenticatenaceae bacterium]
MTQEQESGRLIITEEDVAPFVAEKQAAGLREHANQVTQQVSDTARQAWESETRRKMTGKVRDGVSAAANKSSQFVRDKVSEAAERQARETVTAVQNRIKETDWKEEARQGTVRGLQWLSQQLARLADRFTPAEKNGNR